ncbi:hypothetical protein LCGC14_0581820 [marine sediment metagenome]|uniref:Uncharacterized protein n=1 Tax=marine sediment metagenome TaxID=412755 RepID=A0A0F9RZX5_9ZZZZ
MDIRVLAQQESPSRGNDGQLVALRALRDGAVITCPWYQALVLEGRCFSATGPGTYDHAGMTLRITEATDEAAVTVDIPDGLAAIPLYAEASFLATGAIIVHAAFFVGLLPYGVASATLVSALNLRLDNPIASGATAQHTNNSGITVVDGTERMMFHFGTAQDLDATVINPRRTWSVADAGYAPVAMDASSLALKMSAATSGTGFGLVAWAELPESAIN